MSDSHQVEFVGGIPAFVKALLRGGGKSEHDTMKLAAWSWLRSEKYELIDFETGGFDVLAIHRTKTRRVNRAIDPLEELATRVVVDAKTSMSDLYNHFKKDQIPYCDLKGRFSTYATMHFIIARKGVLRSDAVHDPWGLLEYDGSKITVTKDASYRAFIGHDDDELYDLACRSEKLLRAIVANPSTGIKLEQKIDPAILKDKEKAEAALLEQHEELAKALQVFQYIHGYNPVRRLMGDE